MRTCFFANIFQNTPVVRANSYESIIWSNFLIYINSFLYHMCLISKMGANCAFRATFSVDLNRLPSSAVAIPHNVITQNCRVLHDGLLHRCSEISDSMFGHRSNLYELSNRRTLYLITLQCVSQPNIADSWNPQEK